MSTILPKVPKVFIVVPFTALSNFIFRTVPGKPQKELPWRLHVVIQFLFRVLSFPKDNPPKERD